MTRLVGLLALLFAILFVQAVVLTEAFGSSQGGAQIQLAASRPILVTSMTPGSLQIPRAQQASVSSWLSPY